MTQFINKLVYFTGFLGPIITIPQVIQIWVHKNTQGVSTIMWFGYLIVATTWFLYGFVNKQKPLILIYITWILIDITILVGLFRV